MHDSLGFYYCLFSENFTEELTAANYKTLIVVAQKLDL